MSERQITIKQLVGDHGLNYDIFLPAIQRPFVWLDNPSEIKIENLFDSLLKGYPIGSFLLWRVYSKDIKDMRIETFTRNYDSECPYNKLQRGDFSNDHNDLVLDGQQRLTALYIGLAGSRKIKRRKNKQTEEEELYINLDQLPDPNIPNSSYRLKFLTQKDFIKYTQKNEHWYKCKDILTVTESFALSDIYPGNKNAYQILHKLLDVVNREYSFPEYELTPDTAVEIFSRINKGGEPLEKTDLLMSFIAAKFKESDIKAEIQDFVQNLADNGFKQFGCESFLTACMVLANNQTKFSVSDFTPNAVSKIEQNWDKIISSINKTIEKLKDNGYAESKISTNIIISLAFAAYKGLLQKASESDILDFIRRAQFTSFFDSRTDSQLKKIIDVLEQSINFGSALNELQNQDFQVSTQDIEDLVENTDYKKSATAYTVLQLLFGTSDGIKDIDHIYPESQFYNRTHTRKKDKLFNLQFLSREGNRGKKKDLEPQQWLDNNYPNQHDQDNFRKANLLPDFPLTWQNVEKFEDERKKLLINTLKEKFGLN